MNKSVLLAFLATLLFLAVSVTIAEGSTHSPAASGPAAYSGGSNRKPTRTPVPTQPPGATTAPANTPGPTSTPTPYVQGPQLEQQTIALINQRRAGMGLGTLLTNPALTTAARNHSNDIGPLGLCQHNGTDGSSPWSRITAAGYTGSATGEVVGCGFPSSQSVVDAWWNSPAHYSILTDATANDIGCGWWVNSSGYGWATCDLGWSTR